MQDSDIPVYRVWTRDHAVEKPVELPALVNLIRSGRVTSDSWIFADQTNSWVRASQLAELSLLFKPKARAGAPAAPDAQPPASGIKPGSLRRIKVFADMPEPELESFLKRMEPIRLKQFSQVVAKGDHGDCMYFIMEGELRARVLIDGSESTLATFGPGEFFGEIALLDQGPRSADVLTNKDSLLLKFSADAFESLLHDEPGVVAPFLFALSRSVVGRMRTLTKRYQDSIHFSRVGGTIH